MSRIQAPAAVETHSIPPFFRQRFSNTYPRQFSLGQIPRKRLLLRASAKPLLARALLRVRRAAAANDRAKAGVFAHSPHRALGCRRRMQHTRFGGQQYFGRHRKRYCSAPPFDANQSRFLNGQTAQKLFRKYLSEETAKFGCTVTALPSTSPANASYSLEKLAAEWGRAIRAVLVI